jgi:hypothetical protein
MEFPAHFLHWIMETRGLHWTASLARVHRWTHIFGPDEGNRQVRRRRAFAATNVRHGCCSRLLEATKCRSKKDAEHRVSRDQAELDFIHQAA